MADHDFIPPDAPRAYPYGIYDLKANTGFVNLGTDHDTSGFAVASIRAWWEAGGGRRRGISAREIYAAPY